MKCKRGGQRRQSCAITLRHLQHLLKRDTQLEQILDRQLVEEVYR